MKSKKNITISCILTVVALFLFVFKNYLVKEFSLATFEQLLYSLTNTEGESFAPLFSGAIYVIKYMLPLMILFGVFYCFNLKYKDKVTLNFKLKNKKYIFKIFPINLLPFSILLLVVALFIFLFDIGFFGYLQNRRLFSNIYDEYYVNPKDIKLEFPDKKRNLVYIFVESLEMTSSSIKNGGAEEISYIPHLENLALENINFSNSAKLGGAIQINNVGWTIGGMVAQTSGIPLNLAGINRDYYYGYGSFMPGATTLGDILLENGYSNYLMLGSNATYGGRKDYFTYHGNYTILDYKHYIDNKTLDEDYFTWWGYEDNKLFEYAKKELGEISKSDKPFNFTILTADTHFTDGYLDESCNGDIFDKEYANVFYCSDSMIYNFIKWIKRQDFYENTTIIISGDHLTMQANFYDNIDSNYDRVVYNSFINSAIDTINNKNRKFATIDMFPTTLASLGVKIEGNKLGLGTNLFSNNKTLLEKKGIKYVNKELVKKSLYYNNNILSKKK